ncbi:MAG: DUF1772 domain-containing protein [Hydrogenophaga sp.]|uniref:anthrone oxygenase family protein n=1 Tax=Hydrogenophaga sp. TaxID=1904254 RepID=UPI0016B9C671|nr:anthrone oxygenase family protein [Hydrogenophaga sp.]NIM39629.1 DUF1772 domain-containing protein [Hydrogenophaga sp.]NIN24833.1 DUF1772 domain-containing protein [Hydrogenophaga sp.]NIN29345.1 DUF1772 domain-containing protein [Hydrogenophaga sp.]NIN53868.1 DUF1772 domain-containing protein [Hydrogenophaga sp.]NIO50072.1 DUF1772 domain-containing protein [Hydrogenophaga sp.]
MNAALAIALIVGSGLMAGVFFAFSTFVMKALAQLPAAQGVAAMQRINVVVLNPMFLGCFMGTAVLGLLAIGLAVFDWRGVASAWMVAAGLLYVLGCFGVTMAFNVPRNERLARLDADAPEATGYWPRYVREWTFWNHVRTLAPTLAVVCAAMALLR